MKISQSVKRKTQWDHKMNNRTRYERVIEIRRIRKDKEGDTKEKKRKEKRKAKKTERKTRKETDLIESKERRDTKRNAVIRYA